MFYQSYPKDTIYWGLEYPPLGYLSQAVSILISANGVKIFVPIPKVVKIGEALGSVSPYLFLTNSLLSNSSEESQAAPTSKNKWPKILPNLCL